MNHKVSTALSILALLLLLAQASCIRSQEQHRHRTSGSDLLANNDQDCSAHQQFRSGTLKDDSEFRAIQKVQWIEKGSQVSFIAKLRPYQDGKLGLFLEVKNEGPSEILILADATWRTVYEVETVHLAFGDITGNYGNEVPALRLLSPGRCIQAIGKIPINLDRGPFTHVAIGFYGIFEGEPGFVADLVELPEVNGWWQLSDQTLTEKYYEAMAYPVATFSIPATSPLRTQPQQPVVKVLAPLEPATWSGQGGENIFLLSNLELSFLWPL